MNNIIAITGPSGAGKSAVAKALCKKFERCVRIDIDRVKHFVETGFVYDDTREGKAQWSLCVKNVVKLAKNFHEEGYSVIIEGYLDLESPGWADVFDAISVDIAVMLLPSEEVLQKRNVSRKLGMQMGDEDIARHIAYFESRKDSDEFIVRDTSSESIEETVQWILSEIECE